jgi:hypothetical protein
VRAKQQLEFLLLLVFAHAPSWKEAGQHAAAVLVLHFWQGGLLGQRVVAVAQPQRIAALSVAKRIAEEQGSVLGHGPVGNSVRFGHCFAEGVGRILLCTDGILLRELLGDPLLSRYAVVMVDEAHEKNLETDLLLALLKKVLAVRRDLRVIVCSATVDVGEFERFFSRQAATKDPAEAVYLTPATVHVPARQFPVDVLYLRESCSDYVAKTVAVIEDIHAREPPGDVLAFLTGREEIESAIRLLRRRPGYGGYSLWLGCLLPIRVVLFWLALLLVSASGGAAQRWWSRKSEACQVRAGLGMQRAERSAQVFAGHLRCAFWLALLLVSATMFVPCGAMRTCATESEMNFLVKTMDELCCLWTEGKRCLHDDPRRYDLWGQAAVRGLRLAQQELVAVARARQADFASGAVAPEVILHLGRAFRGNVDQCGGNKVFGVVSTTAARIQVALWCVRRVDCWEAAARAAVKMWLLVGRRLGVVKDIRGVIARLVMDQVAAWAMPEPVTHQQHQPA